MSSRAIPVTVLSALVFCAVLLGFGIADAGKKKKKSEFPSVKEALAEVVHARKWKVKRSRVDALYDFATDEQADDFASGFGGRLVGGRWINDDDLDTDPGKLYFPRGEFMRTIRPKLDVEEWHAVTFWIQGADEVSITFRNDENRIWASLDEYATLNFDEEDTDAPNRYRTINLLKDENYRIECLLTPKKITIKLDGKTVMESRLPKHFQPMTDCSIRADGASKIFLTGARLVGTVSQSMVVVAANKGRQEAKKPPLWHETFRADGTMFRVRSSISQDNADWWLETLETQCQAIYDRFPPKAPEKEPAESGENTEFKGDDEPAPVNELLDDGLPVYYVFGDLGVYRSYREGTKSWLLSGGGLAIYDSQKGEPESTLRSTAWVALTKTRKTLPTWWVNGLSLYFGKPNPDQAGYAPGGVDAKSVAAARKYLDNGIEPRLSVLLHGTTPTQYNAGIYEICWAWVHFLEQAEDGKLRPYMDRFHDAMLAGKSFGEAGEEVFPIEDFNEMFPRFKEYLESL